VSAKYGRAPLKSDYELNRAAHAHNMAMARANMLTHQAPGELSLGHAFPKYDIYWAMLAENCAWTSVQSLAATLQVHAMMMAEGPPPSGSTNHYSNLLNRRMHVVGVDVEWGGYHHKLWITEDFADA